MNYRIRIFLAAFICVLSAAAQEAAPATIFEAAGRGDVEAVAGFLKGDPKLAGAANAEGDTVLHLAAGCRRGEEIALPVVRLLLKSGADVNARNSGRQTPLLYASYAGFARIVELFVSHGALVQYQDANGRSPLHYAAREGHPEVVEFLIKSGADLSLRDSRNQTPLDLAVQRNKASVVETLLKLGRYDIKGPEGSTLLHAAASQGNAGLVKSLLDQGADPSRPSPNGDTLLLSYLRGGLEGLAIESILKGADVNGKDAAERTALHIAVERGLEEAVSALLDKGADPNAVDKNGRTAIDIARDWGARSTEALLTAKSARPGGPKVHVLKAGSFELADPPAGAQAADAVIRYIGTDGFLIQAGSKTVLVDGLIRNQPWGYTDTPERALDMMKAGRAPFEGLDLLLFSHAHGDHFEPRMALDVLASRPQTVLVGDGRVAEGLQSAGPDAFKALGSRVVVMDTKIGELKSRSVNGIPLTTVGVNHADREPPYLTLGYIMDLGPFRIYHQGDLYPEANKTFLPSVPWESLKIDIAFFDPFFLQNEWARRIVNERIRPSAVILMHMREDEGERYFTELKPVIPQILYFQRPMESKRFAKASH